MIVVRGVRGVRGLGGGGLLNTGPSLDINKLTNGPLPPPPATVPPAADVTVPKAIMTAISAKSLLSVVSPYLSPAPPAPTDFSKTYNYPIKTANPLGILDTVQKQTGSESLDQAGIDAKASAYNMGQTQPPAVLELPDSKSNGGFVSNDLPPDGTPVSNDAGGMINGQTLDQHKSAAAVDIERMAKADFSCFGTWWCPAIIAGVVVGAGWLLLRKR